MKSNLNEGMPSAHSAGHKDPSGLLSADMESMPIPDQGWSAMGEIPGLDSGDGANMKSASGSQVDFAGSSMPGEPFSTDMSGKADLELPLNVLMSADEPMGPRTGAGLRSAVGEDFPLNTK